MPIGRPTCRKCLGTGELERIEMHNGVVTAFIYEPCHCTFQSQWVDEEDWTNDRHR